MTRLSAHIGYLYTDLPLVRRMAAAAADGFTAVEHPEPWEIPPDEMAARLADLGLTLSQVTSGMGKAGEKGLASLPGRETEFRDGFRRALDYARAVGCPFVHPMAGVGGAEATYRANLDWAVRACEGSPARVLVEAITLPGYHMATLAGAMALQDAFGGAVPHPQPLPTRGRGDAPRLAGGLAQEVAGCGDHSAGSAAAVALPEAICPSPPPHGEGLGVGGSPAPIALLFDSYHARTMGEDPAGWLRAHAARVGHVHIADHPGRHEPGTGQIDFDALLAALRAGRYPGAIGFEYIPSATTAASLGFLPGWAARLSAKACP